MTFDAKKIESILRSAQDKGRDALLETEGLELLQAMGVRTPKYVFVKSSGEIEKALAAGLFREDKVVIKVISEQILHKSDVGGVKITPNNPKAIKSVIEDMEKRFAQYSVEGYTVNQFIRYDASLGHEILFGARFTADFGPVVTVGPGGIYTEFLSRNFLPGKDVAILQPSISAAPASIEKAIKKLAIAPLLFGGLRGQKGSTDFSTVKCIVETFLRLADTFMPRHIQEFEINPMVATEDGLVALDVLLKLPKKDIQEPSSITAMRPVEKIKNLLEPKSAAIIGVSEKLNPGHIILNNLIRDGFDKKRIFVIKPDTETLEGCRCIPDIKALPEKVDLFVLAISAAQVPETITQIIDHEKAESIIVIPGGLEEKEGTAHIVAGMQASLLKARKSPWRGPVINGGNCLGIRSNPGHYDTMFIPEYKLPLAKGPVAPIALVSQSGAFAISRSNKLSDINFKFLISVGNQSDLTIGDYLDYLKDDPDIKLFPVYVEGFKPLDGQKFLRAAKQIVDSGRTVILYRAGRTADGAKASASHTASIAGDFSVTRELAQAAGIIVAETFPDFDDLIKLFANLQGKKPRGLRLGAVSNAGCECVAIADSLGRFSLAPLSDSSTTNLKNTFKECRISDIVDIHNPVDLTPMAGDAGYDKTFRTIMEDDNVDVGIVGIVPLTPALNSLPKGPKHGEDFSKPEAIAQKLAEFFKTSQKPWVAVVDAGQLYDEFSALLETQGIPVFRTADRALKLLNIYCSRFV